MVTGNTGTDVRGCGLGSLESLAASYTGGDTQQVLNRLGFFLRALSTVYSISDCERLVTDTISRLDAGLWASRLPGALLGACTLRFP